MKFFNFGNKNKENRGMSWNELFSSLGFGAKSKSGISVNEDISMSLTAVYGCAKIIAESVASLPIYLYQRVDGGKNTAETNPLYDILHSQANEEVIAYTFYETLVQNVVLWGNGYVWIDWNNAGRVKGLWNLLPGYTEPLRDPTTYKLYYQTQDPRTGEYLRLDAENIIHVVGFGYDPSTLKGKSPVRLFRDTIGLGLSMEEFGSRFFDNGTYLGGVFEHPSKLSDDAYKRLKSELGGLQGIQNTHKIKILEEGMKFNPIGIPPEDAQFLQSRKFQIAEIARIYRVPLHMLAELDKATNNNIEHQSLEFIKYTLAPYLKRIEQSFAMKLLTPAQRRNMLIEFDTNGFLRGDFNNRVQGYKSLREMGTLCANEIRAMENLNTIKDGDIYIVPLNYTTDEKMKNNPQAPNSTNVPQNTTKQGGE